jgi:hypothetical protein
MQTTCTNIVDVVRVLESVDALVDNHREADALSDAIAFLKERLLCIPSDAALEDFYPDTPYPWEHEVDQSDASTN